MIEPKEAAAALVKARLDYTVLDTFPGGVFPADISEAYAVLDCIVTEMGVPVGGWKAALTNDAIMQKMGTTSPACGPLFQPYIMASPRLLNLPADSKRGLECEFAFRMGAALPPRPEPYTQEEVCAAAATLHPAIEVVDARVKNGMDHGAVGIIADHCANAAFVYGRGEANWRDLDLAAHESRLSVNGEEVIKGTGQRSSRRSENFADLACELSVRSRHRLEGRGLGYDREHDGYLSRAAGEFCGCRFRIFGTG